MTSAPSPGPDDVVQLASGFEPITHAQWQALVAKVLNRGRPEDKQLDGPASEASLRTTTVDGLTVEALYAPADGDEPLGYPGVMPYARGSGYRPTHVPWGVRALHDDPDVATTRAAVLTDLENGVTSLWVQVGDDGVRADDLGDALSDVMFDLAQVCVSSDTDQKAAADALRGVWRDRGVDLSTVRGNLGHDPLGLAAHTGGAAQPEAMLDAVAECLADFPQVRAITIDLRRYHDAGAGDVDEVAFAVATGVEYLRLLGERGVTPTQAFSQIDFRVNAGADQFLTIAKLRALRWAWARVGEECDVPETERGTRIHAVTSRRMISRDDPYVNILRGTTACFGAATGGADAITVLPFDTAWGLPNATSRRIARNTQILLAEESHIGRVIDPAGGSWYVESLTDQLVRAAWEVFQQIEAAGGMTAALADGLVAGRVDATSAVREQRLSTRDLPLTGVSTFPQVNEQPLVRTPRPAEAATGLRTHRDSEIFEQLRDRSTAYAQQHGCAPSVFVACLGQRRDFGARETFTSSLLAVAGLAVERSEGGTADEIGARAKEAGARVAVLCSSRDQYGQSGVEVARALRAAGVEAVYIAGKASELGENADAVDEAIFAGSNVVPILTGMLDLLGAPRTTAPTGQEAKAQR